MARIPETEIERLKNEVSVERLVEASGIELKRADTGRGSRDSQLVWKIASSTLIMDRGLDSCCHF